MNLITSKEIRMRFIGAEENSFTRLQCEVIKEKGGETADITGEILMESNDQIPKFVVLIFGD